jgi:hypothetical protein
MVWSAPQFSDVLLLLDVVPAAMVCHQEILRTQCCFQIGMPLQCFTEMILIFLTRTATVVGVCLGSRAENVQDEDSIASRSAKSVLSEITNDNMKLREGDKIEEQTFDIGPEEQLVPMWASAKLVVVGVPGTNEAGVVSKFKDHVSDKWVTFDCAIAAMDGKQGVNTEDQVFLLSFVKHHLAKKGIPMAALFNKVDDPQGEEQAELMSEARAEVQKILVLNAARKRSVQLSMLARSTSNFRPATSHLPYAHFSCSSLCFPERTPGES